MRCRLQLARWLGPWASEKQSPRYVVRRSVKVSGERPFELWTYRPAGQVNGALMVIPGLHFLGPSDPRMDRFARVLASGGLCVTMPFLQDFLGLRLEPSIMDDTERAFARMLDLPALRGLRPGVFSISFGSLPALRLAASPAFRARVGGVVLFGGFGDPLEVIRFSVSGKTASGVDAPHDPLNQSVPFINFIHNMPAVPVDAYEPLRDAWRRFILATWGQIRYRTGGDAYHDVAHRIAAELPEKLQHFFLVGVGVEPGGIDLINQALEARTGTLDWLDPRPHLHRILAPVTVIHGRDDDVIPFNQAQILADALPSNIRTNLCLTGLYEHSSQGGSQSASSGLAGARGMARELATMVRMLEGIVQAATQRTEEKRR